MHRTDMPCCCQTFPSDRAILVAVSHAASCPPSTGWSSWGSPIRQEIGVQGHSYGGYTVLALITQTEMFAAAVCSAGAVNLTSFYGALSNAGDTSWLGWCESGQARLGGSLWESRDAYIENSSLFYLDRVTTPLLLLSGDADPGAFTQAGETFSALRRLGQRVELRNYRGEDHWSGLWSRTESARRSRTNACLVRRAPEVRKRRHCLGDL